MAQRKGKSHKIHHAIQSLEEALSEWDALDTPNSFDEESDSEKDEERRKQNSELDAKQDARREKTAQLIEDLKSQLDQFDEDPEISH